MCWSLYEGEIHFYFTETLWLLLVERGKRKPLRNGVVKQDRITGRSKNRRNENVVETLATGGDEKLASK